jgi:hypothetical protein
MVIKIEDGSTLPVSVLLSNEVKDPQGNAITFSQVGSTNTYTATVALNDGSGRNQIFRFDKPDSIAVVSRKVQ